MIAACHACHAELDQGRRFTKDEKRGFWQEGWERTMAMYFNNQWLKVAG